MKRIVLIFVAGVLINLFAWTDITHLRLNFKDSPSVTYPLNAIDSVTYSAEGDNGMTHINIAMGASTLRFALDSIDECKLTYDIPVIDMITDDGISEIKDKLTWHQGTLSITPNGFQGVEELSDVTFQLRGRGNSTLKYPKKPYRIKFESKTPLHTSLRKAKNYALIANYIDPTNMRNAVAFEIARALEMPYTNHCIPVWVTLNGHDKGLYMLTEKIGLNSGSVHDIDETKGILLELDTNFDEDYKFVSDSLQLPVMVKDPDFAELQEKGVIADPDSCLERWKDEFSHLEARIVSGDDDGSLWEILDLTSTVNYLFVNNLTRNTELHHPKSVFLYKPEQSDSVKFAFGPVWDFDWAYTFNFYDGWGRADEYLFDSEGAGTDFFSAIIARKEFQEVYARIWDDFYTSGRFDDILDFIDSFARIIQPAVDRDNILWPPYFSDPKIPFAENIDNLKSWLKARAEFINTADNFGFYVSPEPPLPSAPEWDYDLPSLLGNLASASVSDPMTSEGGGLLALFDDNPATYYQSQSADNSLHDPVYGSYVDMKFIDPVSSVQFILRPKTDTVKQADDDGTETVTESISAGTPDEITIYTSTDGDEWTELSNITGIIEALSAADATGQFGCFKSDTSFNYIRVSVTRTALGSLAETDADAPFSSWNCSDLLFFGNILR